MRAAFTHERLLIRRLVTTTEGAPVSRRFLASVALTGLLLVTAGPASATPPEQLGPFVESGSFVAGCGDFDASITGTVSTR